MGPSGARGRPAERPAGRRPSRWSGAPTWAGCWRREGETTAAGRRGALRRPRATSWRTCRPAGASFLDEIVDRARAGCASEVEDALGELVSAGRVTGDGFSGLRALISATQTSGGARARWHARWVRRTGGPVGAGRWSILRADRVDEETRHEALARQYIKRYGVVFRDLLAREAHAPAWRDLVRVYRRLEMSGELRGGRLVGGFVGEQFAAPEAVDVLRATRRQERTRRGRSPVRLRSAEPGGNPDTRARACRRR